MKCLLYIEIYVLTIVKEQLHIKFSSEQSCLRFFVFYAFHWMFEKRISHHLISKYWLLLATCFISVVKDAPTYEYHPLSKQPLGIIESNRDAWNLKRL